MVNFKVCHRTAELAAPAVSSQYLLVKLPVIFLFEPDRHLFRRSLIHWIFSVTNCAKACFCSPGRNLKKFESVRKSTSGSPSCKCASAKKSAQIISRQ